MMMIYVFGDFCVGFNVTIGIEVINNFAEYIQETINERKSKKEEDR